MQTARASTRRAALAAFLLFAAGLFVVGPAEASRTTDARSSLVSSSSRELASLELPMLEPLAPVESSPRFGFAEDLSLLDVEARPCGFEPFGGVGTSRCALTYARNNPLKYVDPDGKDEVVFGNQVVTVFPGEVIVLRTAEPGPHVATYVSTGSAGEVFVFDSTKERNRNLDIIPDGGARERMKEKNPDNTGATHGLNDLNAAQLNGKPSVYSAANGATVEGVVPADRRVSATTLADAAKKTNQYHGSSADGNKQCSNFCADLAKAAGYKLSRVGDPNSTESYRRAIEPGRVRVEK